MQGSNLIFNFVGLKENPPTVESVVEFSMPYTPAAGDIISFEGSNGAFLVQSREFKIDVRGKTSVILNLQQTGTN